MNTITFNAGKGEIRQLILHEPEGEPRAVIQIVHGMAEHYKRYYPLAEYLCDKGYAVAGHDLIGHGPQTPATGLGYLGDRDGWQGLVNDLNTVHTILCRRWPNARQVMLGHSMGSFLAREYVMQHGHEQLDGLVLSGTGFTPPDMCGTGLALAQVICMLGGKRKPSPLIDRLAFSGNNRTFEPSRTPLDWLSRDEKEVDKYIADPYCGFVFTGGAYRDLFKGLKCLTKLDRLSKVPKNLPVLMISGERDPVGGQKLSGMRAVVQQYRQAGLTDITIRTYPEGRHEMFNEINRDEVRADLHAWLSAIEEG